MSPPPSDRDMSFDDDDGPISSLQLPPHPGSDDEGSDDMTGTPTLRAIYCCTKYQAARLSEGNTTSFIPGRVPSMTNAVFLTRYQSAQARVICDD